MPRVQLKEKERYPFVTTLTVRVTDLNYGAHLGHDHLLGLAHEARLEMLASWGVSELDLGDGRTGVIAGDLCVSYQGEAFRGDALVFEIAATEVSSSAFRLAHRIRRADKVAVALLEIGLIAFDYEKRRIASLPPGFAARLAEIQ